MVSFLLGGYGFFVRVRPGLGGRKFVRVKATAFFGLLRNHLELFYSMNPFLACMNDIVNTIKYGLLSFPLGIWV